MGSLMPYDIEALQKRIGKEIIVEKTDKGKQKTEQYLVSEAEIQSVPSDECIVVIRDIPPFIDKRLDFSQHPNYAMIKKAETTVKVDRYFKG